MKINSLRSRLRLAQPHLSLSALSLISITTLLFALSQGDPLWAAINYTGCGGDTVAIQNGNFEAAVVVLVNQERAKEGLPPMKAIPELTAAARYHAADMAHDDYFSHDSKDQVNGNLIKVCSWSERVKAYYSNYRSLGENIAWGYGSPESVMQGWMNSSGHRRNILGSYTEIGVGYFDRNWVQDFGVRRSVAALIINREAIQTFAPEVTLYVHGDGDQMRLRNDDQDWSGWRNFQNEINWQLQNVSGERRVYIEVQQGGATVTGSDTIVLSSATAVTPTPVQPTPTATPVVLPPDMDETVYLPLVTR